METPSFICLIIKRSLVVVLVKEGWECVNVVVVLSCVNLDKAKSALDLPYCLKAFRVKWGLGCLV